MGDRPRRIFITVAETSGDLHAAQLVRSLRGLDPHIQIEGVGGPAMAEAGVVLHRDTVANAAMGLRGALRAGEIFGLLRWTRRRFDAPETRPDLWIGVDSPSMNFHFARVAKERGIPTLQYVAPQLWAWASWRMKKVRRWVDRLACIFPFEEEYFRKHGVNAAFVGHPLFDGLPADRFTGNGEAGPGPGGSPDHNSAQLTQHSAPSTRHYAAARFPEGPPIIGILPGSRKSIVRANLPRMLEAAGQIERDFPKARFLIPTTAATDPIVREIVGPACGAGVPPASGDADCGAGVPPASPAAQAQPVPLDRHAASPATSRPSRVDVELNAFDEMVPRCDLCLSISGTSTLHVAAYGVPMVVVYSGSRLLWNLVGRWLVKSRTFAMVNILAAGSPQQADPARHLVPEFIPWCGPTEPVASCVLEMLHHPQQLEAQRQGMRELVRPLDRPGASDRVAQEALRMMEAGGADAEAESRG